MTRGCLDPSTRLSRNGGVIKDIPLGVSADEFTNSITDLPSVIQRLIVIPTTNPPHLNLLPIKFSDRKFW